MSSPGQTGRERPAVSGGTDLGQIGCEALARNLSAFVELPARQIVRAEPSRVSDADELYRRLASEIPYKSEQARFLSAAGP